MTSFGPGEGLDIGECNTIHEDDEGRLWVLGIHGLSRWEHDRFVTIRRPAEVPLESLTGMAQDSSGVVWLNSLSSITRLNPDDVINAFEGRWERVRARVYDAANGVGGSSAASGRSLVKASNGLLWLLTSRGLAIIDPTEFTEQPTSTFVHVDGVVIDERRATAGLPAMLPPLVRRIEIDYSSPDLWPGHKTRFRYRLDGFDTDWHQAPANQRRVVYTNLPPGAYAFRIESLVPEGADAPLTDVWNFSVQPAFYQTVWFAAVCLVAAGSAASLLWRRRLRHVRREFTLLLKERVRLSREIHDTLLQSLIGVALRLEQVEHDVDASPEGRERLTETRRQVETYIREARDSIWNLRSSALEREGLAAALRHAGERAIAESRRGDGSARLTFAVTGAPDTLAQDVDEQLLRIGQEAVTNATRHGDPTDISMELEYDDRAVTLRVSDNGRGFDPESLSSGTDRHWGLVNMRERAAAAGGTLRISSARGVGTEVEATIPKLAPP